MYSKTGQLSDYKFGMCVALRSLQMVMGYLIFHPFQMIYPELVELKLTDYHLVVG